MSLAMPRKPGPKKRRIELSILETTAKKLEVRAALKGESLPTYLARNLERAADKPLSAEH